MTGFGTANASVDGEEISVEIRSVNHKFCDVKFRTPREFSGLESELMRRVKGRLHRGALDISIRRSWTQGERVPHVDLGLARAYAKSFTEIAKAIGSEEEPSVTWVAAADGVLALGERALDPAVSSATLQATLDAALTSVLAMREREGAALTQDIQDRLNHAETALEVVAQLVPQEVASYHQGLAKRVGQLIGTAELDHTRLAQEVALLADRADVAEEIARFRSHIYQIKQLLLGSEPAGRKLEFLVQELHREANTIGSKSQSSAVAHQVVVLKMEIERMKEQVQNVE